MPGVWGAVHAGEGPAAGPSTGPAGQPGTGGAVVPSSAAGLPGAGGSAVVVQPGQHQGPGPGQGHTRRRERLAAAIAGSNRAVADVAAEYGVSWHTAHRALVAAAARWLPQPPPTRVLGIDETRTRTVRWVLDEIGAQPVWRRSDPWMTSFVDAEPARAGVLLGLASGRSGPCVRAWLGEQRASFRDQVELVVIDLSVPYASGIRAALPAARIAVDKRHVVRLANILT